MTKRQLHKLVQLAFVIIIQSFFSRIKRSILTIRYEWSKIIMVILWKQEMLN